MRFRFLAALDTIVALAGFLGGGAAGRCFPHLLGAVCGPMPSVRSVNVVGAWIGAGFVPGLPRWEPSARQNGPASGPGLPAINVFTFIARNLDNVLIGRVWGDARSALYDRAYKFLLFPLLQINAPLARVMLPTLARLRTDAPRYRSVYLRAVNQLLLVTQPGIVFAIADRRYLCPVLLGERVARERRRSSSGWV